MKEMPSIKSKKIWKHLIGIDWDSLGIFSCQHQPYLYILIILLNCACFGTVWYDLVIYDNSM